MTPPSAPAKRGRGTARRAVEGAQDSTRRKNLRDVQTCSLASSCNENLLQRKRSSDSGAPSTTVRSLRELQWSPSPAIAGAEGASALILAAHSASEFCRPKPPIFCLQKNKGRRSAEKAQLSRRASPRIGCCHPLALRALPRVQRDALAFRRSTAALASAMCRGSIQAALHVTQCAGVSRALASRLIACLSP